MNSVRIAYIVTVAVFELLLLVLAIITPVYFTIGNYWWSAFCILLLFATSAAYTKRVNSWEVLGKT